MSNGLIGLVGLGATGAPLANLLFKTYRNRFALLSDECHAEKLRNGKLHINGESFDPRVLTSEDKNETIDILFVCVKNYSLESTFQTLGQIINAKTIILPLQNGLFSYSFFRKSFPDNIVLEGFVQGPNTKKYGDDIVYQNPGVYHLGKNFSGYKEYAKSVYEVLINAGVPCKLEDDIRHAIWRKLMLNVAGNALTALTELDYIMFKNSQEAQKICRTVMQEYKFVAATEDVLITERDINEVMEYFLTYNESKHTSMLEDVLNKRKTENEYIAGYIKRVAEKNGVNAPFIDMLYSIMKIREDVYLGKL